jgi:hypothetical protein
MGFLDAMGYLLGLDDKDDGAIGVDGDEYNHKDIQDKIEEIYGKDEPESEDEDK